MRRRSKKKEAKREANNPKYESNELLTGAKQPNKDAEYYNGDQKDQKEKEAHDHNWCQR